MKYRLFAVTVFLLVALIMHTGTINAFAQETTCDMQSMMFAGSAYIQFSNVLEKTIKSSKIMGMTDDEIVETLKQSYVDYMNSYYKGREVLRDCGKNPDEVSKMDSSFRNLIDRASGKSSNPGGCLIATATYGTELAPEVQQLRETRDNVILKTKSGMAFMSLFNDIYYSFSPVVADLERENPVFKELIKIAITPLLASLSILNHTNIDSEHEILGYGIGIISLNIGMYLGLPVFAIVKLTRRFL